MTTLPPPFPDRLRRRAARRRLRWWPLPALAAIVGCLAGSQWQVTEVSLEPCPGLPPACPASLAGLVGSPVASLDLQWVRGLVEAWPAVASVDVRLELPGTLHVVARPAEAAGSVRLGRRWLVVDRQGRPAGISPRPVLPALEGFPDPLRARGLAVAERLETISGTTVVSLRRILPDDVLVTVILPDGVSEATVHVLLEPTAGECWWGGAVSAGTAPGHADVRWDQRVVVETGGAA